MFCRRDYGLWIICQLNIKSVIYIDEMCFYNRIFVEIKNNSSRRYIQLEHILTSAIGYKQPKELQHLIIINLKLFTTCVSGKRTLYPVALNWGPTVYAFLYLSVRNNHILQPWPKAKRVVMWRWLTPYELTTTKTRSSPLAVRSSWETTPRHQCRGWPLAMQTSDALFPDC